MVQLCTSLCYKSVQDFIHSLDAQFPVLNDVRITGVLMSRLGYAGYRRGLSASGRLVPHRVGCTGIPTSTRVRVHSSIRPGDIQEGSDISDKP